MSKNLKLPVVFLAVFLLFTTSVSSGSVEIEGDVRVKSGGSVTFDEGSYGTSRTAAAVIPGSVSPGSFLIARGWGVATSYVKSDVDTYTLTFSPEFLKLPICTCSSGLYSSHAPSINSISLTTLEVTNPDNLEFHVICIQQ